MNETTFSDFFVYQAFCSVTKRLSITLFNRVLKLNTRNNIKISIENKSGMFWNSCDGPVTLLKRVQVVYRFSWYCLNLFKFF